jgi:hypothetical protein
MNANKIRLTLLSVLSLAFSTACGGSKFIVNSNQALTGGQLGIIGVSPHAPQFANTIARNLNARGFSTADSRTMEALMSALGVGNAFGLQPDPTENPQAMAALAKNKVDAILSSTEERVGMGTTAGKILKAHIRLTRTSDGSASSEFTWENAWGGMPGSPADASMRKDDDSAAQVLVEEMLPLLGSPGPRQTIDLVGLARSEPSAPARARQREDRSYDAAPSAAPSAAKPWWKDEGSPTSSAAAKPAPAADDSASDDGPAAAKPAPKPSSASDNQLTP